MFYALINNNIDDIVFLNPYYEALSPEAKEPIVQSWAGGLKTQFETSKHLKKFDGIGFFNNVQVNHDYE